MYHLMAVVSRGCRVHISCTIHSKTLIEPAVSSAFASAHLTTVEHYSHNFLSRDSSKHHVANIGSA